MRFQIGVSLFWFFFTANIDGRCRHLFIDAASSAPWHEPRHLTHGRLSKADMWTLNECYFTTFLTRCLSSALFISISFHRSAARQFPVTCSQRKTGQRWHVNNCEHWKISALLVAIPCQQTVSTNFLCAQSRCNRQTHKVLTSHTHRNLFSLISLQLWIWIFVLETEMPVFIAIHCSSRAVFCFEISREPRLFILAGRQVFAGLIGLLLDLRGK